MNTIIVLSFSISISQNYCHYSNHPLCMCAKTQMPHMPALIPALMPHIPALMPHILALMPHIPTLMPHIPALMPHMPALMPHIPALMPHIPALAELLSPASAGAIRHGPEVHAGLLQLHCRGGRRWWVQLWSVVPDSE